MGTSSHVEETSERAEPPPAPATRRIRNQAYELGYKVIVATNFYANKKVRNKRKRISPCLKDKMDAGRKEVVCSMQEVMRQFSTILEQLFKHKWADPFMKPVDVKALDLDDYYEIVKKPMDFTTIKNQMAANVYKNVREIYADARLVFSNSMTYNDIRHDYHIMARSLLEKLEEKWLELLPEVIDAETRQKEEEDVALATMQITQEAAIGKLASDAHNEGEAKSAQLIGQEIASNPAVAAREVAQTISNQANKVFLNSDELLLNLQDIALDNTTRLKK